MTANGLLIQQSARPLEFVSHEGSMRFSKLEIRGRVCGAFKGSQS